MIVKKFFLALVALVVVTVLGGTASAGIDPVPFHVIITNRTNQLAPSSTFYNATMSNMVVTLTIDRPTAPGTTGQGAKVTVPLVTTGGRVSVAPGETLTFPVASYTTADAQLVSWSFSADVGIEPSPFKVFAYETPDAQQALEAPSLPPAYLTGEMPILGFNSPGVVLGTSQMVADQVGDTCPAVRTDGTAWKNHGQYVRCVSQEADFLVLTGVITTDQADAIVTAAAQSDVGKK
jgi:hypothetical protein